MKGFTLLIQSSTQSDQFDHVNSFVGEDSSGSFGILAGHERFITSLNVGLFRVRFDNGTEEYFAIPGGILYFCDNALRLATRYYLHSSDYQKIAGELDEKLSEEEKDVSSLRETLHRIDEKVLRRLWELQRGEE